MSNTAGLFEKLYNCLKSQEEIIDRLITAGEEQLRALKENNLDDLNKAMREQESCAAEMERTEQQRLLLQASLEEALKIDKCVTLSKLLPFAPEAIRISLQQLLKDLPKKLASLGEINALNAALIKKALLVNGRLIRILYFLHSGLSTTYGIKGEIENKSQPRSVLNKSV
ncbi:MAG: FlgN protein [Pelotomaculum sp. PtaU1.Bin035]|nr:MAG: FlgN protein [Pelotomaculum sp. PtaU1.Bin035]